MSEFQTKLNSVPSGGFLTDRDKDKKPILDVRELGIDFGGLTAVDGFNLMIGRNEITGLIGPNGAGKTTVFNLLTNVYQPTRGSILSATVLTILPEATRSFDSYRMVIYSLVLILMMIFRPGGLLGSYDFSMSRVVEKIMNGELFKKNKEKEGADHE